MSSPESTAKTNWNATLVAIIGIIATVIAGLGGSFIAGTKANEGIAQQFAYQRGAELEDLRRDTYATYLRTVEAAYQADPPDEQELKAAEAIVLLLATPDVRDAAIALSGAALGEPGDYFSLRTAFIEAAQRELSEPPN